MVEHAAWGWTFPYLVDADQTAALAYGAPVHRTSSFDGDRRLVYRGASTVRRRATTCHSPATARCSGQCARRWATDQHGSAPERRLQHQVEARQRTELTRARADRRGPTGTMRRRGMPAVRRGGDAGRRCSASIRRHEVLRDRWRSPRRRRHEHGDQPWVTSSKATARHFAVEVVDGSIDQRLQVVTQPFGTRLGQPAQLADSPSNDGVRTAAEHGADDRLGAVEWLVRRRPNRRLDCHGELRGGLDVHGVDELVLWQTSTAPSACTPTAAAISSSET